MHFTIQLGGKENRLLYRGLRYIEVRFIEVPLYVTSVEYKSTMQSFWPGGGGSTKFYAGSLHPEVQPLILLLYTIKIPFLTISTIFRFLFIITFTGKCYPFHIPSYNKNFAPL